MGEIAKPKANKWLKLMIVALVLAGAGVAAAMLLAKDDVDTSPVGSVQNEDGPVRQANEEISEAYSLSSEGDSVGAADSARVAVEMAPNDPDILINAAYLIAQEYPEEGRQLYARALELYIKLEGLDEGGKSPAAYWAAGNLAENAGLISEAISYHNQAIDEADLSDPDEQAIVEKSQAALERLQ